MKINKQDIREGFYVVGMVPTCNPKIMSTLTFCHANTVQDSIIFGRLAFKSPIIKRVEVQGKKTFNLYYVLSKKGGRIMVQENKTEESKSLYNSSTI